MSEALTNFWAEGFIPQQDRPIGQTVYWMGSDRLDSFIKDPAPGYTETSITYTYNSLGYREQEFNLTNQIPKILCLGCSHTEGVGLKIEDVWISHIKQNFPNHEVYNLGLGGGSADTVARILTNTVSVFNPQIVFIFWPSISRYETWQYPGTLHANGVWNMTEHNMYMLDELQSYNNFKKNQLIVKFLQEKYKFKLCELENDNLGTNKEFMTSKSQFDRARDQHYGPSQHRYLARLFLEQST